MAGFRFGWILGPPALSRHLFNLLLAMLYGGPPFIQDGALAALAADLPEAAALRASYRARGAGAAPCRGRQAHRPLRPRARRGAAGGEWEDGVARPRPFRERAGCRDPPRLFAPGSPRNPVPHSRRGAADAPDRRPGS